MSLAETEGCYGTDCSVMNKGMEMRRVAVTFGLII